ncbi:Molybdate-binding protein ModA [Sinobacterium norvegicum]|uniref:Molybdate-binding protein ModA n=1 Tax=Sinobacterium norvegicum TaxID=1641715 RepID=A0ABN8EHN5_9GAMM|nr:molybdate ABC transporter substrate-binding protein [Sinobacterium norvegicum]CAH0991895.1 Molybdate-binding protein ModA [Sinobacterium norvegicum]
MPNIACRLIALTLLLSVAMHSHGQSLRVAVAANFKPALELLQPEFERQTGIKLRLSAASSGVLFAQISHGAPFDVFLSADVDRAEALETLGLVVAGSRQTYAFGTIALISKQADRTQDELITDISNSAVGRLAIANPQTAPYGVAAQQLLSCWQQQAVFARAVRGNNIAQVMHYAATDTVDIAVIAQSLWPGFNRVVQQPWYLYPVPSDCYQPLEQQLVILQSSRNTAAAKRLVAFLLSAESQQVIAGQGYLQAQSQTR